MSDGDGVEQPSDSNGHKLKIKPIDFLEAKLRAQNAPEFISVGPGPGVPVDVWLFFEALKMIPGANDARDVPFLLPNLPAPPGVETPAPPAIDPLIVLRDLANVSMMGEAG